MVWTWCLARTQTTPPVVCTTDALTVDFQRLILFTGLALVLVLIWQAWIEPTAPPVAMQMTQTAQQSGQGQTNAVNTEDVPSAPTATSTIASSAANEVPKPTLNTLPTGKIVAVSYTHLTLPTILLV